MEYRQLPHGLPQEKFSVLGIGMGGIQNSSPAEIETVVRKAIDHGINFFDLCAGGANPSACRKSPGISGIYKNKKYVRGNYDEIYPGL